MIQALPEAERIDPLEDPRRRLSAGLRRWWWVALAALLLSILAFAGAASKHSSQQGHHRNPRPEGSMALAHILGRQGVRVEHVTRLAGLEALASEDATIFLADPDVVTAEEFAALRRLPGDIVIAGSPYTGLEDLTSAVSLTSGGSPTPVIAECSDPDAAAASRISAPIGGIEIRPGHDVTGCFPMGESYGYAVWSEGDRTFRLVSDYQLFSNDALADDGNAALTLRALGHHPTVLWYLPLEHGTGLESHTGFFRNVPPVAGPLVVFAGLLTALAALTYGRRMGPVVQETLPVIVKPGEATLGRGRLYHRAGATGHAAQGMRAGTARRLARRLGLTRSAPPHELVTQIAAASGWPEPHVREALYGPPPSTSADLVRLSTTLKQLEESSR